MARIYFDKFGKIFVCGLLVSYAMYSYSVIETKMNKQEYISTEIRCRQSLLQGYVPPKPGETLPYPLTCSADELTKFREQGRFLLPAQLAVLDTSETYLEIDYWRYRAIGVFLLSALPVIWIFLKGRLEGWHSRPRKKRGYTRKKSRR